MRVRLFVLILLLAFAYTSSSLYAQQNCNPTPCPSPSSNTSTGFGTEFEISPYAGYVWNGNNNGVGSFINNQLLGVRGGAYVTSGLEIGANWSWNNHFQPKRENTTAAFAGDLGFPQAHVRSNLGELEFTYHFGSRSAFGHAVKPYLVGGAGAIFTNTKNGNVFVLNNRFIDVPGVSPDTLQAANQNGTLQNFVPGINTTNGVAFVGNAAGTGSTVVVANDVLRDQTFFTFSYGGGLKLQRLWGPLGFFGDVRGRTIPNFFNGHGTNLLEVTAGLNFAWGEK